MKKRLNQRRKSFFENLKLTRGNAKQAALMAGYSPAYAAQASSRILRKVLDDPMGYGLPAEESRGEVTVEEIQSTVTPEFILEELLNLYAEARRESTKVSVLELLGKYRNMWNDKTEQKNQVLALIGQITKPREIN